LHSSQEFNLEGQIEYNAGCLGGRVAANWKGGNGGN
jgi:hypothetical protein